MSLKYTVKPPIKDTLKEDKPGQAESTLVYTLYRKSPLKEDNLSTKDKMAGPGISISMGTLNIRYVKIQVDII